MSPGCVYGCSHPLWNSDGTCTNNNEQAICVCSSGYASKDVYGNPSCVPIIVLRVFFIFGAVCGAAMTLFLGWHIVKYLDTRASVRRTRKAVLRLQILMASSTMTLGMTVCCAVVAFRGGNDMDGGEANLWDYYIIQTIFAFFCPVLVYAFPLMIEYWLLGLPSQFLRADGLAIKVQDLASSHHIFPRIGVLLGAVVSAFAAVSFGGARWALCTSDMIVMISTDLGALIMGVIGFEMVAAIKVTEHAANDCLPQAKCKKDDFYGRAKRRIWTQVFGCCLILMVNTIAVITFFFTHAGRSTPVIPLVFHVFCGLAVSCPFAHLTAFAGVTHGGGHRARLTIKARPSSVSPVRATCTAMKAVTLEQFSRSPKEQKVADQQAYKHHVAKIRTPLTAATPRSDLLPPLIRVKPVRVVPPDVGDNVTPRSGSLPALIRVKPTRVVLTIVDDNV